MRHIKTINDNGVIIVIDSGVSKTNFTHRNEVFKHLKIAFISKEITVTVDRIVYQDVTRNFKRVANLSVKIETIAYNRFNLANENSENFRLQSCYKRFNQEKRKSEYVAPQMFYKRFTTLEALIAYTDDTVSTITAKMGL